MPRTIDRCDKGLQGSRNSLAISQESGEGLRGAKLRWKTLEMIRAATGAGKAASKLCNYKLLQFDLADITRRRLCPLGPCLVGRPKLARVIDNIYMCFYGCG